eukprot:15442497-Alexandrium_andersonii.AAC.1
MFFSRGAETASAGQVRINFAKGQQLEARLMAKTQGLLENAVERFIKEDLVKGRVPEETGPQHK